LARKRKTPNGRAKTQSCGSMRHTVEKMKVEPLTGNGKEKEKGRKKRVSREGKERKEIIFKYRVGGGRQGHLTLNRSTKEKRKGGEKKQRTTNTQEGEDQSRIPL